jgi:hypothetical protein
MIAPAQTARSIARDFVLSRGCRIAASGRDPHSLQPS